ncbi:MAG: hypothetical protein JXK16_07415 [Thiotrichales bacterium]|nr:hypothetical protein [Thiotrichales bacterium]
MKEEKAKFTWHYYGMALGALMAMLAGTLGSVGGIVSGVAFAILCHPVIKFQGVGRFIFLILFMILYVFAFPDADVVREMMSGTQ